MANEERKQKRLLVDSFREEEEESNAGRVAEQVESAARVEDEKPKQTSKERQIEIEPALAGSI
ncbi:MAG: hypothetical protein GY866_26970 [Proteobacteria bacterium]|nr:hypothetical protein [Pseudomonadota bacterium]